MIGYKTGRVRLTGGELREEYSVSIPFNINDNICYFGKIEDSLFNDFLTISDDAKSISLKDETAILINSFKVDAHAYENWSTKLIEFNLITYESVIRKHLLEIESTFNVNLKKPIPVKPLSSLVKFSLYNITKGIGVMYFDLRVPTK